VWMKERARSIINSSPFLWDLKRATYDRVWDYLEDRAPRWVQCPQDIQIDTHNYCSSTHEPDEEGVLQYKYTGCAFCNVKEGGAFKIPRGRMDDDLLKYIIDYWATKRHLGTEYICPYVNGDPIIDDRLPWINQYSMEKGLKVVVDTSGNVYKNREWLVHPNLTLLRFSISAITSETYEKVQGCPKFKEALDTFHYVADNKHPSQQLELHFMVNSYNEHEVDEYVEYFKGYKIKLFPLHEMPDIQLNSEAVLPSDKWRNKVDTQEEWEQSRPLFIYPNGRQERQIMRKSKTCQGMAYAVQWDGTILHCTDAPPDYADSEFYLGQVKADGSGTDMLEAWHQRNKQRIRHPGCIACNAKRNDWESTLKKYVLSPEEWDEEQTRRAQL